LHFATLCLILRLRLFNYATLLILRRAKLNTSNIRHECIKTIHIKRRMCVLQNRTLSTTVTTVSKLNTFRVRCWCCKIEHFASNVGRTKKRPRKLKSASNVFDWAFFCSTHRRAKCSILQHREHVRKVFNFDTVTCDVESVRFCNTRDICLMCIVLIHSHVTFDVFNFARLKMRSVA
jgi:hypothetical protein